MARQPRDLVVRFLSDVKGFLNGTDRMEEALRDVARDEERLADAGEDSARRLTRAYDRAADEMVRDQRRAHRDVREGFADTGKEAGQEFTQNLGEAISSGDVSGLLGDTAGGLAATFGATGKVGAAFAALAGVAAVTWAAIQQDAEKTKEVALAAFDSITTQADKRARLNSALEAQYGSVMEGLEAIQKMSDSTGIDVERIKDAFAAGGPEARKMAEQAERIKEALAYGARGRGIAGGPTQADVTLAGDLADDLNRAADATERAARAAKTYGENLSVAASYYTGKGAYGLPSYATGSRRG